MGLVALINPNVFTSPSLHLFADNALLWTMLCIIAGCARVIALVVNGKWNGGTPMIRLLGSALGASMFGALAGSFISGSIFGISWGFSTYGVLMLAEIINVFFSADDVAKVKKYGG